MVMIGGVTRALQVDEFVQLPYYKGLYQAINRMSAQSVRGEYHGWVATDLPLVFRDMTNPLYHSASARL